MIRLTSVYMYVQEAATYSGVMNFVKLIKATCICLTEFQYCLLNHGLGLPHVNGLFLHTGPHNCIHNQSYVQSTCIVLRSSGNFIKYMYSVGGLYYSYITSCQNLF